MNSVIWGNKKENKEGLIKEIGEIRISEINDIEKEQEMIARMGIKSG